MCVCVGIFVLQITSKELEQRSLILLLSSESVSMVTVRVEFVGFVAMLSVLSGLLL